MASAKVSGVVADVWRSLFAKRGALRSMWAVMDQGVVSGCSFLFNLVLARFFPEREFGTAVLIIGALYLLQSIHRSLILYPLSLRIAVASDWEIERLTVSAVGLSVPLSLVLGGTAAVAAIITSHRSLALILVAVVLASQTHELLRWVFLARMQHQGALVADVLRHGSALMFLAVFSLRHSAVAATAIACMTGGALIGVVWQAFRLRLRPTRPDRLRVLAADAWSLGRWDLVGGGIDTISSQVMPWSLAAWYGTVETARLQAVANILGATHPLIFGLGNLITPAVARVASGRKNARPVVLRYAGIGFMAFLPYLGFLFLFPGLTLSLVYGSSSSYATLTTPLRWFAAIYGMVYVLMASRAALNGLGRSADSSLVSSAGLVLQIALVLPLAVAGRLPAACRGACIANTVEAVLAIRLLWKATDDGSGAQRGLHQELSASSG